MLDLSKVAAPRVLVHRAANAWERFDQALQPLRLAPLAYLLPLGMITVLQPPRCITPDRLDVRARIRGVEHVLIGRRHGEPLQSRTRDLVTDGAAARRDEPIAATLALAPDGQGVGRHIAQPEPPQGGRGKTGFQLSCCLFAICRSHRKVPLLKQEKEFADPSNGSTSPSTHPRSRR
jgi:hypothetical protein